MEGRGVLQVGGLMVAGMLTGSLYLHLRNERRDELTQELITELRKEFNPTTQGLPGLEALDENYLSKIRKGLSGSLLIMRNGDAAKYAERINKAWGVINDDEEAVYQVLRELKDKVQVSQVAVAYKQVYGISLSEEFTARLSDSEIKTVVDIIKSKTGYRKA